MTAGIGAADAAVYTGVCVENDDPRNQGRIRYSVPQLSGTAAFGWALPITPGYTPIGANVYVAFEGGDRNRPLYWPAEGPLVLPYGFRGMQQNLHTSFTATGSNATLIASASFNNPSAKRVYKITATCSVTASTTTNRAQLTILRSTTAPASTISTSVSALIVSRIPVGNGYLGLSALTWESNVTPGLNYYAAYISTEVSDGTTVTSLDNQILIEDIGANT